MNQFRVVIPSRMGSTRLPRKPLALIAGKPMIQHVVTRAMQSQAIEVIVAVDHEDIATAVREVGATAMLTSADHTSGTDRVHEVAERLQLKENDAVVNVQGDEPLIPPAVIDQAAATILNSDQASVGTLSERIENPDKIFDSNVVKVVRDVHSNALYFSRAPIPWARGIFPQTNEVNKSNRWERHIGIYAYRVSALRRFIELPPSTLEITESLEQLRFLENCIPIKVEQSQHAVPTGVDVPEDLVRVEQVLESMG